MNIFRHIINKLTRHECQIPDLVSARLMLRRSERFQFAEIGVFKGDNAVQVIRRATRHRAEIRYIGFDFFENNEEFSRQFPEEFALYDGPYWEFQSNGHALDAVREKIGAMLPETQFTLIPGDSTRTVPDTLAELNESTMVYIDGCHEYEIVSQDWRHIAGLYQDNPNLIVVFDDAPTPGVARVRREIESESPELTVYPLNSNQFFVISSSMDRSLRWAMWWLQAFFRLTHKREATHAGDAAELAAS